MSVSQVMDQWRNPGNILDLLLLVGGDVVAVALAQYTGNSNSGWVPPPVVFSFGWVAYSFAALVAVLGAKRLTPSPDTQSIVINVENGYVRDNQSWMLGRLLRDFEDGYWMDDEVKTALKDMLGSKPKSGLCISVYEALQPRIQHHDWLYYFGYFLVVAQVLVAAIPWIRGGENYIVFVVTLAGTLLSLTTAALPQWRRERFDCRTNTDKNFVLTRGNGAQHAIVILGSGSGMDLEDLAAAGEGQHASFWTRAIIFCFTVLWVVLLITVDGLKNDTWFLVAAGGMGSLYTAFVAALPRRPDQVGIPLRYTGKCYANSKGMLALLAAEKDRPGLGRAMLETFFPGDRSAAETTFWETAKTLELQRYPPSSHPGVDAKARELTDELNAMLNQGVASVNSPP